MSETTGSQTREVGTERMAFWKRWFDMVHEMPELKPMFAEAIAGMQAVETRLSDSYSALIRIRDHFDMDGDGDKTTEKLYADWKNLALEMAEVASKALPPPDGVKA